MRNFLLVYIKDHKTLSIHFKSAPATVRQQKHGLAEVQLPLMFTLSACVVLDLDNKIVLKDRGNPEDPLDWNNLSIDKYHVNHPDYTGDKEQLIEQGVIARRQTGPVIVLIEMGYVLNKFLGRHKLAA